MLQVKVLCPWTGKVKAAVILLCASADTPPHPTHTHTHSDIPEYHKSSHIIPFREIPKPRIEIRWLYGICSEKERSGWESAVTYVRISDGEQMACGLHTLLLMELKDNTFVICRGCVRPDVHVHKNTLSSCWPYVMSNLAYSNDSSTSSEAYIQGIFRIYRKERQKSTNNVNQQLWLYIDHSVRYVMLTFW